MLEVLYCCGLILICSFFSFRHRQGLEKQFLLNSGRVILQLYLLGYFLDWIFRHQEFLIVSLVAVFMTLNSVSQIKSRIDVKHPGLWLDTLLATVVSIWPLAILGAYFLKSQPIWRVDLFLPLLGMLLGNTLNGISLGINYFSSELVTRKDELVARLALGATSEEATLSLRNRSLKVALTPLFNSMASMGLVSIPGMMSGQILGGESPIKAAVVQMMMMLLMCCGTYLATTMALVTTLKKKFTQRGVPC